MHPSSIIFEEFSKFDDDRVMLAFRGNLSENLLDSLLQIAEDRLVHMGCRTSIRKKAFHILVECMQNIYNHAFTNATSSVKGEAQSKGMLIMTASSDGIHIATGNSIDYEDAEGLRKKLKELESLHPYELKKKYQEQLVEGNFSERGGAGLGFIDIARKSGQQVEYDFAPLDNHRLFFTFNVKVA